MSKLFYASFLVVQVLAFFSFSYDAGSEFFIKAITISVLAFVFIFPRKYKKFKYASVYQKVYDIALTFVTAFGILMLCVVINEFTKIVDIKIMLGFIVSLVFIVISMACTLSYFNQAIKNDKFINGKLID